MMAIVRMVLAVGGMMVLLLSGVFALWRPEAAEVAWMVYATRASRGAEIIRMSADGTNQARIARLPLDDVSDLEWSSSGAWIVFNGITFSNQNIHRIQPTGRNLQQLTHSEHASFNAVWSPNGQLIAYILSDYADRSLNVMNADGSGRRRLSEITQTYLIFWSLDSEWIYFEDGEERETDLYRVRVDGMNRQAVTGFKGAESMGQLSPDGEWLVYFQARPLTNELFRMRTDGSDLQQLTEHYRLEHEPEWSPSGEQVLFTEVFGSANTIYVMQADGSQIKELSIDLERVVNVHWSPDGEWISFIGRKQQFGSDVYRIRPDGTDLQQLTETERGVSDYTWSPLSDTVWDWRQTVLAGGVLMLMAIGLTLNRHKKLGTV